MAIFDRFPIWDLKVDRATQLRPEQHGFEKGAILVLQRRVWAYINAKNAEVHPSEQKRFLVTFGPNTTATVKEIKQAKESKRLLDNPFPYDEPTYLTVKRIV